MYLFWKLVSQWDFITVNVILLKHKYSKGFRIQIASVFKRWSQNARARDMDGPRECHTEWSESGRQKQTSCISACAIWLLLLTSFSVLRALSTLRMMFQGEGSSYHKSSSWTRKAKLGPWLPTLLSETQITQATNLRKSCRRIWLYLRRMGF